MQKIRILKILRAPSILSSGSMPLMSSKLNLDKFLREFRILRVYVEGIPPFGLVRFAKISI